MVRAVHQYGVKFGVQLIHAGAQAALGQQTVGPSAVAPLALVSMVAREMPKDEIKECVKAFGSAAQRAVKAGFDFVEISANHGYLVSEFLTPYYNRRTDEYGGNYDNRIRFLLEIIREMKDRVGSEVAVGVRMNGDDFIKERGWELIDACRVAPILEKEGVNYLSISGGIYGAAHLMIQPMYDEQGVFVPLAAEVKRHTSIPVITVGRIKDPVMADRIIKGKSPRDREYSPGSP